MVFFLVCCLASCTPTQQLNRAKALEKKGKYYQAWEKYQEVAAKNVESALAPEALFRAGWLAQRRLNDCDMAGTFYQSVVEKYPQADPWARLAASQRQNCPDYFPLYAGMEWKEGDSDTKGKNARIEIICKPFDNEALPSQAGVMERTYYGGETKFKTVSFIYKKTESELLEFESESDPRSKVIFRWPVEQGARWKTKSGGRLFEYEVLAVDKKVEVAAGSFEHCVQVRFSIEGIPGSTNEYYAPGIGRILTTVPTPSGEKRNTELLSYKAVSLDESINF